MNIATLIAMQARELPDKKAVVRAVRKSGGYVYPFYTFAEFETRSGQIASRLIRQGARPGDRVALFVRPSLDFSVIVFALFKAGLVPVLIDPGMGRKNMLNALSEVNPDGLIAVELLHWMKLFIRTPFKNLRWAYSVSNGLFTENLLEGLELEEKRAPIFEARDTDPAAILFTSGGTGTPKGVITTHGILRHQTYMLKEMFELNSSMIDLPGFPLFALFTLALGMTSVIPDMDPTKPAKCDPLKIIKNLIDMKVQFAAGSPAIWQRVGEYARVKGLTFPDLKYVVMFGAPVRAEMHALWDKLLPEGTTYTPYGATECLPVTVASGRELMSLRERTNGGAGTCVGRPAPGMKIMILSDTDIPKTSVDALPAGEIGEICVQGPPVTPGYFNNAKATARAKIETSSGLVHRMGDVGYLDGEGKLWFLGRQAHVVRTKIKNYYPIAVEAVFNRHPQVLRSALVSLNESGEVIPGLVVELKAGVAWSDKIKTELLALGSAHPHTKNIIHLACHSGFPVDVRHNIKIDRVALSRWMQECRG